MERRRTHEPGPGLIVLAFVSRVFRKKVYRVRVVGRETIEYREGDVAFSFNAGWGVRPPVLEVPSEREWREWVPEPFRERREEIVERVAAAAVVRGHVIHYRS